MHHASDGLATSDIILVFLRSRSSSKDLITRNCVKKQRDISKSLEANIFLRVTVETYLCKGAEYEKYLVNILVDEN